MPERLRNREMTSYFHAVGISLDSDGSQKEMVLPPTPRIPEDATLTALAQIGVLRLDCDRAFISLIGRDWQYIIAETTNAVDSYYKPPEGEGRLTLGVSVIPCDVGVCLNTIRCFTDEGARIQSANTEADQTRYRTRDLRLDPLFQDRPYVTGWPHMRAYLEVPLRSATGLVIGSYCVVDSKLRDDFDDGGIAVPIMVEVAQIIMNHLDLLKTKQQCERAERLVRGLSVFVDGCSSLRATDEEELVPAEAAPPGDSDWSTASVKTPVNPPGLFHSVTSGTDNCGERLMDSPDTFDPRTPGMSSSTSTEGISDPSSSASLVASSNTSNTEVTTPFSSGTDNDPFEKATANPQTPLNAPAPNLLSPRAESQPGPSDVKMTFSRAANLIREGASLEGIVFLDACPSGFGANHSDSTIRPRPLSVTTPTSVVEPLDMGPTCEILGCSTGVSTTPIHESFRVSESLLQRIIQNNPHGNVIYADEHGAMSPLIESVGGKGWGSDQQNHKTGIEQLLCIVPQARSILCVPLWDYQKQVWYAAAVAWTTDPTRSIEEKDVTYIQAFSNSIMIEVSRLDALHISRAKSDFISSISHEFRSPLHGIMAVVEMIEQELQNPDHKNLLGMVKSCAITLLDTTNQVLDYAKINQLTKDDRTPIMQSPELSQSNVNRPNQGAIALSSVVDLGRLVEEVVEGVYLGNLFQNTADPDIVTSGISEKQRPLITLQIEKRNQWTLRTEPGAWRRIVMNLFGNALKYTTHGSIEVVLKTIHTSSASGSDDDLAISFSVKDTGCGMNPDFLKRHLFTAYVQENPFSQGVGLGLSIVSHLVEELGGSINVHSTPGAGTLLEVIVPMSSIMRQTELPTPDKDHHQSESGHALAGQTLFVSTFDDLTLSSSQTLLSNFTTMSKDWLDVNVLTGGGLADVPAGMPWVVLCGSVLAAEQKQQPRYRRATFLAHPFGPSKLAWTVAQAFARQSPTHGASTILLNNDDAVSAIVDSHKPYPCANTTAALEHGVLVARPKDDVVVSSNKITASETTNHEDASTKPSEIPLHILLVDDNSVNLKILTTLMKKLNCSYVTAINGLEAVRAFQNSRRSFDYVFMDISMPVMDGFEATRTIRAIERDRADHTKTTRANIIALTGLGSAHSQKEAYTSGVDRYMMKPVPLKQLREILQSTHP